MGFSDLTIMGNDGASDLESRLKEKTNIEDMISLLMDEIKSHYTRWNTPGFINAAIVLARGSIDFNSKEYEKLLKYFVPRLRNLLQESIQKVNGIDDELAREIKQLLIALINKYPKFKEIT